jgi:hypothetical protein
VTRIFQCPHYESRHAAQLRDRPSLV